MGTTGRTDTLGLVRLIGYVLVIFYCRGDNYIGIVILNWFDRKIGISDFSFLLPPLHPVQLQTIYNVLQTPTRNYIPQPRVSDGSGYRPAPNALCAYERTARPAGNALIIQNSKVKIQKTLLVGEYGGVVRQFRTSALRYV